MQIPDARAQLRSFALSLPDASEDFPLGERIAKVKGKVFVFLGRDAQSGPRLMTVKLIESHGHARRSTTPNRRDTASDARDG